MIINLQVKVVTWSNPIHYIYKASQRPGNEHRKAVKVKAQ